MNWNIRTALLMAVLLAGCNSAVDDDYQQYILSEDEQKDYLDYARPPQQFGFKVSSNQGGNIALQGVARLHPLHAASVNFIGGDAPVIRLGGKARRMKMHALLDTSSPTSWMEFDKAEEFDAIPLGIDGQVFPYQGDYDTGAVNAFAAVVTQMRIDQLFIENVPLYVRMAAYTLGPLNRGIYNPVIDGVLGYDVLGTFEYIQIDLERGMISFSATSPYTPNENLLMTAARILSAPNYGLAVEGAIFDEPSPIILDIAGNYYFENSNAESSVTEQVSLGEVVYLKVPTRLPTQRNLPPRAGRLMLRKYIITICPKKGVVYFERPLR
ncbi:MAG TPA: hypothetical protein VLL07_01085 [Pontiella sp.]|nr:hypothetical protein [Pontiella sp.]